MRVKGSALYMVIVIALVIGIICSALIVTAYFYRLQYQKTFRSSLLQNNLASAINILVAGQDTGYYSNQFSLFNNGADSVTTEKIFWGIYDIGIAKAFIQNDTLYKVFSMAHTIDSSKWAALYLKDDNRPLSISGKTLVRGNVFIPKAGVNEAYVNNTAYTGSKQLINGKMQTSQKILPLLTAGRLAGFNKIMTTIHDIDTTFLKRDTVNNPFALPVRVISLRHEAKALKNITIGGHIILFSDTALIIDSTAVLSNILVFARSITVKSGFHGTCQLFATDSIGVGKNCTFGYPSCLGILRLKKTTSIVKTQAKISLGANCSFNGLIFTCEQSATQVPPLIHIDTKVKVTGQVYSQGLLELRDYSEIDGSVFTSGFLYVSSFTRYEGYLNNTTIDVKALSPYYLTSDLLPVSAPKRKILQWLEGN